MTSGESNPRDAGVLDAYRAAAEVLDERAPAATRAAILAAAARAVHAQPEDARSTASSAGGAEGTAVRRGALRASRGPLALAASVLVGTVALLLATHTQQQPELAGPQGRALVPARTPPRSDAEAQAPAPTPPPAAPSGSSSPRPASAVRAVPPAATPPDRSADNGEVAALRAEDAAGRAIRSGTALARRESLTKEGAAALQDKREEAPERGPPAAVRQERPVAIEPSGAAQARAESPSEQGAPAVTAVPEKAGLERDRESSVERSAPAPAALTGIAAAPSAAADEVRGVAAAVSPPRDAVPAESPQLPGPSRRNPPAAPSASEATRRLANRPKPFGSLAEGLGDEPTIAAKALEDDPQRWLARITLMRQIGRDEEADRELKRLRERYPDVSIPEKALRRTGTR